MTIHFLVWVSLLADCSGRHYISYDVGHSEPDLESDTWYILLLIWFPSKFPTRGEENYTHKFTRQETWFQTHSGKLFAILLCFWDSAFPPCTHPLITPFSFTLPLYLILSPHFTFSYQFPSFHSLLGLYWNHIIWSYIKTFLSLCLSSNH